MQKIFFFAIVALLAASCKNPASSDVKVTDQVQTSDPVPEDFIAFYEKFHNDSAYQMSHISWPLEGAKGIQKDSVTPGTVAVAWEPAKWHMHRLDFLNTNDYKRDWKSLGNVMIIEQIRAVSVPFGIERRFSKQPDGEWMLIFYSDTHEFK